MGKGERGAHRETLVKARGRRRAPLTHRGMRLAGLSQSQVGGEMRVELGQNPRGKGLPAPSPELLQPWGERPLGTQVAPEGLGEGGRWASLEGSL